MTAPQSVVSEDPVDPEKRVDTEPPVKRVMFADDAADGPAGPSTGLAVGLSLSLDSNESSGVGLTVITRVDAEDNSQVERERSGSVPSTSNATKNIICDGDDGPLEPITVLNEMNDIDADFQFTELGVMEVQLDNDESAAKLAQVFGKFKYPSFNADDVPDTETEAHDSFSTYSDPRSSAILGVTDRNSDTQSIEDIVAGMTMN
jgi:hypothetical protein